VAQWLGFAAALGTKLSIATRYDDTH
jgi:hypothetical protein